MAADTLISICIPTFNGERYLQECLDTCINQTFKDYEIVICDDGSIDKTAQIVGDYMKTCKNIRFFENESNLGLVENWNNCIRKSEGRWIKFVFQDDFISLDCLEKFVSSIDSSTELIVSKRSFIIPGNSTPEAVSYYEKDIKTLDNTSSYKGNNFSPELISEIAVENMCMNFIGEPSLIFFKRRIVDELGNFTDSLLQICDLEFVLRIATRYGLKYIPEKICTFRVHADSATTTNIQNKPFELTYAEPVIFSWFLLYGEHFKRFRSHLNFLKKLKLKLYFKTKVYVAHLLNVKQARNHYLFAEKNSLFKEVIQNKNGSLVVKLIAKFMR